MEIKVLGSGCLNCKKVEAITREAVSELGVSAQIEHVTDFQKIAPYGVMSTPGLVIDGAVKSSGRLPSKGESTSWIATAIQRG